MVIGPSGCVPVAHCKADNKPAIVVILEDDWMDLIHEWKERGEVK